MKIRGTGRQTRLESPCGHARENRTGPTLTFVGPFSGEELLSGAL